MSEHRYWVHSCLFQLKLRKKIWLKNRSFLNIAAFSLYSHTQYEVDQKYKVRKSIEILVEDRMWLKKSPNKSILFALS